MDIRWLTYGIANHDTRWIIHEGGIYIYLRCRCNDFMHCHWLHLQVTIAEHSASASSYRGEILGAIITQIILWAAVAGKMGPYPIMTEDCNKNGVVLHGNSPFCPLSGTQTQANVLRVMKQLITCQPFIIKLLYVVSHSEDRKDWASCTKRSV